MNTMPEHAELFRPARNKSHRLLSYGFRQHLSCISAELCLQPQAAMTMHLQLLALSGHTKGGHIQAASEGRLWVDPGKVKMRGQPKWHMLGDPSILPIMVQATISRQRVLAEDDYHEGITAAPSSFHLSCPRCTGHAEFAHRFLTCSGKWVALKCTHCHITSRANQWTCCCNVPWHTCPMHWPLGSACQKHKR